MSWLKAIALFFTIGAVPVLAVEDPIALALATYPTCAISCLVHLVPASPCELSDVHCLCTDVSLNDDLTLCVRETCSTADALATKNGSATLCEEPVRDVSASQAMVAVVGVSITGFVFLLRVISNVLIRGTGFGGDGCLAATAMALTIFASACAPVAASYGVGKDIWTLTTTQIENALFYFLLGELAYFGAVGFAKVSILVFMLRIFPDNRFRIAAFATMGLVVAYTIAFIVATTFQCQPVSYFWKQLDDPVEGRCNNINLQAWVSAAVNIVLDLIIIALPLESLWSLQLSLARKLTVMAMFSLGIFVTIISAIRMHTFIVFSNSENITWDYKDGGTWSLIELYASIVCACLPSLRALVQTLGSKLGGGSTYVQSNTDRSHGSMLSGSVSTKRGDILKLKKSPIQGDEGGFVRLAEVDGRKVKVHSLNDSEDSVA